MRIACAAEGDAYVAHSAAMLHSTLVHSGGHPARVEYLHSPRLAVAQREKLREMVERLDGAIRFHEIADAAVAGLPSTEQFTPAMWYRLFLPDLLPDAERVLYLDVDTIAVDSLAPLWEIDLSGQWLAAVTNVFQHNHLHRPAQLGLAGPEVYFNSGVLLMNLVEMRRDGSTQAMLEYARSHPDIEWPDQDTLNVVLGPRRLPLHPRWNLMNSMLTFDHAAAVFGDGVLDEARRRPAIRHFEGPAQNKPWHVLCEQGLREDYFEHRRDTPWPSLELEGASLRNVARARLRGLRRRVSA